jgi:hypothetical protein
MLTGARKRAGLQVRLKFGHIVGPNMSLRLRPPYHVSKMRARGLDRWWASRTVRFRLALWYAVGGSVLLTLFAVTLYSYVAVRMARPLDYQLRGDLSRVEQALRVRSDHTLLWHGEEIAEPAPWMTDYPWFELWDEQGNLVRRIGPSLKTAP